MKSARSREIERERERERGSGGRELGKSGGSECKRVRVFSTSHGLESTSNCCSFLIA